MIVIKSQDFNACQLKWVSVCIIIKVNEIIIQTQFTHFYCCSYNEVTVAWRNHVSWENILVLFRRWSFNTGLTVYSIPLNYGMSQTFVFCGKIKMFALINLPLSIFLLSWQLKLNFYLIFICNLEKNSKYVLSVLW